MKSRIHDAIFQKLDCTLWPPVRRCFGVHRARRRKSRTRFPWWSHIAVSKKIASCVRTLNFCVVLFNINWYCVFSPFTGKTDEVSGCDRCDEGWYCNATGQTVRTGKCEAGYYCARGAITPTPNNGSTGGPCPKGHYCPDGRQVIPCNPGILLLIPIFNDYHPLSNVSQEISSLSVLTTLDVHNIRRWRMICRLCRHSNL